MRCFNCLNHYGLVFYFVIFLLFSPQEQRLLSLPLVPHLWIRGQEGAAGPREAEACREGSQRWKAHDRPGNYYFELSHLVKSSRTNESIYIHECLSIVFNFGLVK